MIQSVAFEQLAVLHHPVNRVAVVNVVEWVLVKDDQVRELSCFDRTQFLRASDDFRPVHRRAAKNLHRRHAAAGEHPHLPVIAEPLQLAVAANTDKSPFTRQFCDLRS